MTVMQQEQTLLLHNFPVNQAGSRNRQVMRAQCQTKIPPDIAKNMKPFPDECTPSFINTLQVQLAPERGP
jgi:hypothetical protein